MITKDEAMTARHFEMVAAFNKDGTPIRCRANGKCKTWKTRPNDFSLPVKHGLYEYGYITQDNAHAFRVAK
jgi:hypothetical protein